MLGKVKKYVELLRIKHYIKNFLIFIPLFFSKNLFNLDKLLVSFIGFIAFSLTTSIIYIINDIRDLEQDRNHPIKKNRPIASGKVSIKNSIIVVFILSVIVFALLIYEFSVLNNCYIISELLLLYLILNIVYSFGLKNIPIIDVVILASGFVIRILFGGYLVDVEISGWLYLTIFTISFYLGLGKRRGEFVKHENKETRDVIKYYNKDFFDKNMNMCLTLAICFYALWAKSYNNNFILWTVPIIMIMAMKYSLNLERQESEGNPMDILIKDKMIIILSILYLILIVGGIY